MAYWLVACSVYLYIAIFGANVRICRVERGERSGDQRHRGAGSSARGGVTPLRSAPSTGPSVPSWLARPGAPGSGRSATADRAHPGVRWHRRAPGPGPRCARESGTSSPFPVARPGAGLSCTMAWRRQYRGRSGQRMRSPVRPGQGSGNARPERDRRAGQDLVSECHGVKAGHGCLPASGTRPGAVHCRHPGLY